MKDVKATVSSVRMSPRKMGVVAGLVRGRTVSDALVILQHTPRRAALPLSKVIKSAGANATENHKLDPKTLTITALEVANGPSMKRFRPAARGRALPYKHHTSNIRVVVTGEEKKAKKPATTKANSDTKKSEDK